MEHAYSAQITLSLMALNNDNIFSGYLKKLQ